MKQNLAEMLLAKAEEIQKEYKLEKLSPVCYLIACMNFYATPYTGSDEWQNASAIRLEEEKLRLLISEVMRMPSVAVFKLAISMFPEKINAYSINDFIDEAKEISKNLDDSYSLVRADVLFLLALKTFPSELNKPFTEKYASFDFDIVEVLNSINSRVDAYAIEMLDDLIGQLSKKKNTAIWYRDNYPARKVAEPEEIVKALKKSVKIESCGNIISFTLPYFFADENGELSLTIKKNDETFYITDNGSTNKFKNGTNEPLCFVMSQHTRLMPHYMTLLLKYVNDMELDDSFHNPSTFDEANATEDASEILKQFRLHASYDKMKGIYVGAGVCYDNHATGLRFLLSVDKQGNLIVSDGNAGKYEGEIIGIGNGENWFDEIKEPIQAICDKHELLLKNKQIYVNTSKDDYVKAIAKFFRAGVLVAEYGFGG